MPSEESRAIYEMQRVIYKRHVLGFLKRFEQGPAGNVYFAGDTGLGPHFEKIRDAFGPLRLAMLPIGAFKPRWFMKRTHLSPEQAVQTHILLGAQTSMGIHFATFKGVADDGQDDPINELNLAREKQVSRRSASGCSISARVETSRRLARPAPEAAEPRRRGGALRIKRAFERVIYVHERREDLHKHAGSR